MGTSQSSNGSPSGTPMVPPWTPDLPLPQQPNSDAGDDEAPGDESSSPTSENGQPNEQQNGNDVPIAPPSRFGGARRNMGDFARSGDGSSMKKGVGQYIRKGYGGSATATRRLASTATTSQALFSALSSGAENSYSEEGGALHPSALSGKTAYEVMDIIIETVAPIDGSQDTEASRDSIKDALSDVLNRYPDADLSNLTVEQRELAIERFVAGDVFRRIDLDIGKSIRDKAPNCSAALARLKEVKEYVRETVSSAFKHIKESGKVIINSTVVAIVQSAIRETCEVFEGYSE